MTEKEIEILSDVIIRYCAHEQYGSERKAVVALEKRLKNLESTNAEKLFQDHIKIYNTTKDLVEQKLKNNPHFKDSLFDKLQNKIQQKHDCQEIEAGAYLNWCYFFYVLK